VAAAGRPSYHPAVLPKLYIYGYLNRLQSSRRLEREAQRNVEVMWLTGRLAPYFKTIADFRHDNGPGLRNVCKRFIGMCRELKLFTHAIVATDDSKFAETRSDLRWCSDGLEIKCDSGQTVTATFTKDCCDREVMAWRAWEGKGLPGEPVREMLIESVERRFGAVEAVPAGHELEFLSDNGGAYIAADTRALARSLGLKPINTPVCSPQSNGMAESFVNTFKRDYVARMDLRDARTALAQLPVAFEHFNEVHPSPRPFCRLNSRGKRISTTDMALYCEQDGAGNTGATSRPPARSDRNAERPLPRRG
jgi:putative transposase